MGSNCGRRDGWARQDDRSRSTQSQVGSGEYPQYIDSMMIITDRQEFGGYHAAHDYADDEARLMVVHLRMR